MRRSIQQGFDKLQRNTAGRLTLQALLVVGTVITTSLMFPSGQSFQFSHLKVGDVYTGKEIIAPFTFFINKSEDEIARDRKASAEKIPLVFMRADSIETLSTKEFDDFFESIQLIRASELPDSTKLKRIRDILNKDSIISDQAHTRYLLSVPSAVDKTRRTKAKKNSGSDAGLTFEKLKQNLKTILLDMYAIGILSLSKSDVAPYVEKISVVSSEGEVVEAISHFHNFKDYESVLTPKLRQAFPDQEIVASIGFGIVLAFLEPNLIYDKQTTESRINEAVASVPLSKGIVLKDQRIAFTHERITPEILEKLNSLAAAKAQREQREGGVKVFLPYLGRVLLVSLAVAFTLIFLFVFRKVTVNSLKRMVLIFMILMLVIIMTFILNKYGISSNLKYLIPISIASMLLTIFFDGRVAFISTVTLSIIIGALRGNDFGIMIISLFVGAISTFSVGKIQARAWILKGFLYISGAYFISITTLELLTHTDLQELPQMLGYGLINGLLSPILAYGFMIIFEYIFQMTTNSTLLELSDLNRPLLRELAIRAPGTYHHSIMVGNLSEAASEAIGANALLARVASYYHDIGKMEKPEYFVENQKAGKNPHEKLTPSMSCLILINHVKKGLEIAEEHNLPREIRDFIPQHHGTNLIRFFYQKALESSEDGEVDESSFRYHGPRPRTRETAIVMFADAVEAGSRVLKEPSVSRIRSMINTLIHERLLDHELDECPLTLRDLTLIRESFVNTLTGMFHGRIEYPQSDNKVPAKPLKKTSEVPG
ncbi:MAG: HD family phosphohydrolase [bacterium]